MFSGKFVALWSHELTILGFSRFPDSGRISGREYSFSLPGDSMSSLLEESLVGVEGDVPSSLTRLRFRLLLLGNPACSHGDDGQMGSELI